MLEDSCHCGSARWQLDQLPVSATACNCTACRRYGVLRAYGYEGENIRVTGPTTAYIRGNLLSFSFCPACGGVTPEQVPIDHFDGLDRWEDLPRPMPLRAPHLEC